MEDKTEEEDRSGESEGESVVEGNTPLKLTTSNQDDSGSEETPSRSPVIEKVDDVAPTEGTDEEGALPAEETEGKEAVSPAEETEDEESEEVEPSAEETEEEAAVLTPAETTSDQFVVRLELNGGEWVKDEDNDDRELFANGYSGAKGTEIDLPYDDSVSVMDISPKAGL